MGADVSDPAYACVVIVRVVTGSVVSCKELGGLVPHGLLLLSLLLKMRLVLP